MQQNNAKLQNPGIFSSESETLASWRTSTQGRPPPRRECFSTPATPERLEVGNLYLRIVVLVGQATEYSGLSEK